MDLFLSALGLMMVFEGIPYLCFPAKVREFARKIPELAEGALRFVGLCLIILGLAVAYIGRNLI
jgi:uncharacterized protein YjeT (DUF2065 family)